MPIKQPSRAAATQAETIWLCAKACPSDPALAALTALLTLKPVPYNNVQSLLSLVAA